MCAVPAQMTVRPVPGSKRWQEISARRMELIQLLIEEELQETAQYVFCLDVDSRFHGRWSTESLGGLVAVVHPGQYASVTSPHLPLPVQLAHVGVFPPPWADRLLQRPAQQLPV